MTSNKSTQVRLLDRSHTSSPPPPYHGRDPEQGEDHDHDNDDDSFLDDIGHDDDAIYMRRNNLWAHRSPLELAFGILAFSAMIVFMICFCVTAVVITFSAIRNS